MVSDNSRSVLGLAIVVAVLALTVSIAGFYLHRQFINDDAYISLRYAYNLIQGNGLVWNPGECVEGYTNFLHILLTGGLGALGLDLLVAARLVNGTAFVVMVLMLAAYVLRRQKVDGQECDRLVALVPITFVMTASPLIGWVYGGLEGPLLAMFCTGGILYFLRALEQDNHTRSLVISSLFFAGATLTRPDGVLFVAASLCTLIVVTKRDGRPILVPILSFALPFAAVYGSYFLWRYSYYGQLMPLTFYVKATGFDLHKAAAGFQYVGRLLIAPPYLLAMLAPASLWSVYRRTFDRRMAYLLSLIVVYLLYIVYIGGDYMYSFRLTLPLIPAAALLLYMAVRPALRHMPLFNLGIIYVILFALVGLQYFWPGTGVRTMSSQDHIATTVGRYIAGAWPRGSLVALNTAGATPYFASDHRYIDMLGLNDVYIARRRIDSIRVPWQRIPGHYKGDGRYVLSREPDYIIVGPGAGTTIDDPWFLGDHEMRDDPRFNEHYEGVRVRLDNCVFTYYERRR